MTKFNKKFAEFLIEPHQYLTAFTLRPPMGVMPVDIPPYLLLVFLWRIPVHSFFGRIKDLVTKRFGRRRTQLLHMFRNGGIIQKSIPVFTLQRRHVLGRQFLFLLPVASYQK